SNGVGTDVSATRRGSLRAMLTTKEVCELAQLPPTTLRYWIANGFVVPARLGGLGRNNGHRFSARQVVGIIIAGALHQLQGAGPVYVSKVVKSYEDMPKVLWLDEWLGGDDGEGEGGGEGDARYRRELDELEAAWDEEFKRRFPKDGDGLLP